MKQLLASYDLYAEKEPVIVTGWLSSGRDQRYPERGLEVIIQPPQRNLIEAGLAFLLGSNEHSVTIKLKDGAKPAELVFGGDSFDVLTFDGKTFFNVWHTIYYRLGK